MPRKRFFGTGQGNFRTLFICVLLLMGQVEFLKNSLDHTVWQCEGQETGIGAAGEFYYLPQGRKVRPTLPGRKQIITLPIYPRTQVLLPNTEERFSVPEMKYRRMFNELEPHSGVFGFSYYIPSFNTGKLGLAGTIAKVKKIERIEDGNMFVTVEGLDRYWMDELFTDIPYYQGKVCLIRDITLEHGDKFAINYRILNHLALTVLQELRLAINYTSLLYPDKPLLLNEKFLKTLPPIYYQEANRNHQCPSFVSSSSTKSSAINQIRTVHLPDYHVDSFLIRGGSETGGRLTYLGFPRFDPVQRKKEYYETEVEKMSKFSFAVLSLLKVDLPTKLTCLQTFYVEKRLLKICQVVMISDY